MAGLPRAGARRTIHAALGMVLGLVAAGSPLTAQPTRLDFRDAPLSDVVRSLASAIGLNAIITDSVDRRVSFSTAAGITQGDLPEILESLLEAHGLVLVQQGKVAQVFPASDAPRTGQVGYGITLADPAPIGLVTQLVPLQSIRAEEGAEALKGVTGPSARVEAVARSNALLITDRAANVRRYLEVLRRLDERPQGEAGLRTYVVPLKYATADDLAQSLGELFGVTVAGGGQRNLDDLSLSRTLDAFRSRENDAFRMRRETPRRVPADSPARQPWCRTALPTRCSFAPRHRTSRCCRRPYKRSTYGRPRSCWRSPSPKSPWAPGTSSAWTGARPAAAPAPRLGTWAPPTHRGPVTLRCV
jgi:general secretion pathway protein D